MSDPRPDRAPLSAEAEQLESDLVYDGGYEDGFADGIDHALGVDLPDAEHIHVTRHPDGTITATPMRPGKPGHCHYHDPHNQGRICMGPSWDCERVPQWVDCPTGGDQ